MLALEHSQNTYARLVRGLVAPGALLVEKIALAAGCATAASLAMAAGVSAFVHLDWARIPLWLLAIGLVALAFASLGVAIGAAARDVSAASLMAFLISLPIAFVALVPRVRSPERFMAYSRRSRSCSRSVRGSTR